MTSKDITRRAQRYLREYRPAAAAELTWSIRRRRGDGALAVVDHFVRPGGWAMDVGANWGLFAAHMAARVGSEGRVFAFEPNPVHSGSLDRLSDSLPQLEVLPYAVSDVSGEAELAVPVSAGERLSALGSLAPKQQQPDGIDYETQSVPVKRIDEMLNGDVAQLDLVKCDVEGFELPALRGAEDLLRRHLPVLIVEIEARHGGDVGATVDWLTGLGYDAWCLRGLKLCPYATFDLERDQLAFLGEFVAHEMPADYVNDFVFTPASA